tara:strand:+ start:161 stop:580 length:420 start_codon:yes stop_codon:yes gene_type:complete
MIYINKMKKSELRNIIKESIKELQCEQDENDGVVNVYTLLNKETGEKMEVNQSHPLYNKVSKLAHDGNEKVVGQLTKGQDSDTKNEGILACCWLRGGCCKWTNGRKMTTDEWDYANWEFVQIEMWWRACCRNSMKGRCC